MKVRSLDIAGDWRFGKGLNDYQTGVNAVAQTLSSRLKMFFSDCFFSGQAGIDWFNLLGTKNQTALKLAVSTTILNTQQVTGILSLSLTLDESRNVRISYEVSTVFSRSVLGSLSVAVGTI